MCCLESTRVHVIHNTPLLSIWLKFLRQLALIFGFSNFLPSLNDPRGTLCWPHKETPGESAAEYQGETTQGLFGGASWRNECLLWIVELRTCLSNKMSAKTCQESSRLVVSTCLNWESTSRSTVCPCLVLPSKFQVPMTRTGRAPQAAAWPCGVGTLRWCGAQNGRELPLSMHRSKIVSMDVKTQPLQQCLGFRVDFSDHFDEWTPDNLMSLMW